MAPRFPLDDERVRAFRAALPAVGAGIYLNAGSAGPLPAETGALMAELAGWELRTGRAHPAFVDEVLARLEEARAAVAAVLTADPDEIAITASTSHGMSLASWAVDWAPGDRAVTSTVEHAGGLGPLYALRDRLGIEVVHVEPDETGDDASTIDRFDRAIRPGTKLVSLSHVAWSTGARLPVLEIGAIARARGAAVVVDGAQAAGAIALDVPSLGADFYAIPAQKWLLGPEGVGALWVSPDVVGRAHLAFPGYLSFERIDGRGKAVAWPTARRFDVPNAYKPAIAGFARGIGWLSMYVGLPWLYERGAALASAMAERLEDIPGVRLLTPRAAMATLVTFRIEGWSAEAAVEELGARVFAIIRTIPPLDAIRVSVGAWNTGEELERFASAVELLAAHTPASLPARRTLEILTDGAR